MRYTEPKKVSRMTIMVGLRDKDSMNPVFLETNVMETARKAVKAYDIPFSVVLQRGGYMHENGTFIFETSLCFTFIDAEEEKVRSIAERLCKEFNQESVIISKDSVEQSLLYNE